MEESNLSDNSITIYIAGPLFTLAELEFNKKLAEEIKNKMENVNIILPQEEAIKIFSKGGSLQDIFKMSLYSIYKSNYVVAVLDGPDADSGTSFEMGYAFGLGKKIIGIRTDFRESEDAGVNLMLSKSVDHFIRVKSTETSIDEIANKIAYILKEREDE